MRARCSFGAIPGAGAGHTATGLAWRICCATHATLRASMPNLERRMTTMNNEDPADPSVHEPRELPAPRELTEPAAWRAYFPDEQREELASSLDELCDDLTNCAHDEPEPLYTADQMRAATAAMRAQDREHRSAQAAVYVALGPG